MVLKTVESLTASLTSSAAGTSCLEDCRRVERQEGWTHASCHGSMQTASTFVVGSLFWHRKLPLKFALMCSYPHSSLLSLAGSDGHWRSSQSCGFAFFSLLPFLCVLFSW